MLQFKTIGLLALIMMLLLSFTAFSQSNHHQNGYFHPDSLTLVTVTGTVIVDSTMLHPVYFLDEDGDGVIDYHLNFGPYWYQPDSSNATRPNNGDVVTITGGMHDENAGDYAVIVVYEINGEFWREPYEPFWTGMGGHGRFGGHNGENCYGFAFGWMHDSLRTVSLSGTALVDTTFIFAKYFLDEDGDGTPDYFLNFGPPWYEPESGATRPQDGEQISVVGGLIDSMAFPMVVVYEINGLAWRDSSQIGPHLGGGWMHRDMDRSRKVHAPFDPEDWMEVRPGWHQNMGHHGMMIPDSIFCQMLELFPQNIPNTENQHVFAGYEIGVFFPDGQNAMWQGGNCGGHMNFANQVEFHLHYNDIQVQGFHMNENTIQVKYWDDQTNSWVEVSDAVVDPSTNTVTFSSSEVSNFVVLTAEEVTGIENESAVLAIDGFVLKQNYPNPFNPGTTIEFTLQNNAHVMLNIYNVLGQKIQTLLDGPMTAGVHAVQFDASSLPSGIYFYELNVEGKSQVKMMNLMK